MLMALAPLSRASASLCPAMNGGMRGRRSMANSPRVLSPDPYRPISATDLRTPIMPRFTDREDDIVGQAAALARDIAPDIDTILITHYPDRDTLNTLRPTATDLETVVDVNRAVATELAALGVEIFVQRADRAAFRRWMH